MATATTIRSDILSAMHMATSTFCSLSPKVLIPSRAAARRAIPSSSSISSSFTAATTMSLSVRGFSSSESLSDAVLKAPELPSICTADELHYVSVSSSVWKLALWRYHPSPQVRGNAKYLHLHLFLFLLFFLSFPDSVFSPSFKLSKRLMYFFC